MKARIAPVLASLLVLGGCLARPADGALEEACKTRLGARLAEWTMASVAQPSRTCFTSPWVFLANGSSYTEATVKRCV